MDLPFFLFTLSVWAVLSLGILCWYEPRMIFYPRIPGRKIEQTPQDEGLHFDDLSLTTEDGQILHAWHIHGGEPWTILFCHGNAGNISHRIEKYRIFSGLGAATFAFEYRGYGQSTGRPSECGFYADAREAYDYLVQTAGIPPERIVIYGESLGTGVAVHLASEKPTSGLILEAGFTSIPDVAQKIFPILPVRYLVRNRFNSLAKIGKTHTPLLLLHSREDEIFAFHHPERLFAAAQEPKTLVELRGPHDGAFAMSSNQYRKALTTFLASLPPA